MRIAAAIFVVFFLVCVIALPGTYQSCDGPIFIEVNEESRESVTSTADECEETIPLNSVSSDSVPSNHLD